MESAPRRLIACCAYIPVLGWIFILIFQRHNSLAMFHVRQSIGLFFFLAAAFLGWAVVAWLLAWIPYGAVFSVSLFALVTATFILGVIAWVVGFVYALQGRAGFLPVFGRMANRLPL
jgi:uncharacterized membrane protein